MNEISPNLPSQFIDRLQKQFSESVFQEIIEGYSGSRPISIRINTLKTSANEVIEQLEKAGMKPQAIKFLPDAYIIPTMSSRQLTDLQIYIDGYFYIQSLSSMIPAIVLDPQPDDVVLDMAAAPGSKTTQMAAMMKNKGTIIANDPSKDRLFKLKTNLENQGVTNTQVISKDGQALWRTYPEYFDKVLVDAPCSLEGTFSINKPETYKYWSLKKLKQLSKMQQWLLRSAISCTKPGGTVVYSTCTLSVEENEEIINWILRKEKDSVELEQISLSNIKTFPPFLTQNSKIFHKDIQKIIRILPSKEMEGFFIAKIKKIKSNVHHPSSLDA
jgi:NOL1/NOP2/sun family putative RNA methylase